MGDRARKKTGMISGLKDVKGKAFVKEWEALKNKILSQKKKYSVGEREWN